MEARFGEGKESFGFRARAVEAGSSIVARRRTTTGKSRAQREATKPGDLRHHKRESCQYTFVLQPAPTWLRFAFILFFIFCLNCFFLVGSRCSTGSQPRIGGITKS